MSCLLQLRRISGAIVSCFHFVLNLFLSAFTLTLLLLCTYSDDNTKFKQRRHFSLHELFIDGTEIDLITVSNKSFELPFSSLISNTDENKDIINAYPQLEKVKIFTFYSKPFVWKDFIIEDNVEGACRGGEGQFFNIFQLLLWSKCIAFLLCLPPQNTLVTLANLVPDTITSLFEVTYLTYTFINQPR